MCVCLLLCLHTCVRAYVCVCARVCVYVVCVFVVCCGVCVCVLAQHNACMSEFNGLSHDTCGVRTHALSDWRLKPAP